jgi:hypothetical protein
MFLPNFSSAASIQTNLDFFWRFFKKNPNFSEEKNLRTEFKPSDDSIFFTPEFALEISEFQNSEYEVHQSSPTDERQLKSQICSP